MSDPFGPPQPYGDHREGTAAQSEWSGDSPGSEDPYEHLWRPESRANPAAPSGLPAGPAGEGSGSSDFQTSPGGDYFGGDDPFRSIGAGAADPGAPGRTSAFEAPPLGTHGPGTQDPGMQDFGMHGPGMQGPGMHQPPPGGGPGGPSQMGQYPGDFPMEDYRRPYGQSRPPQRRIPRKALVIGGGALAALIVAAGAAYALTQHTPPPPAAKPKPTVTQQLTNINSVQTDPKPLTGAEVFPQSRVSEDGLRFVKAAQAVNKNCSLAARGSFAHALKAGGCEQVVRATYVDTHKRYAVTAGVAALPTSAAAQHADHKENFKNGAWFTGLNGRHGTGAQNLNSAAGYAYDLVEGRYIIYAFATDANGAPLSGSAKQDRVLNSLSRSFALMVRQPINARAQQPQG